MSLPDDFLTLTAGDDVWWRADVKFMEGTARGAGTDEIEAMEAVMQDLALIARDIASKQSMLKDLINKAKRDLERYNAGNQ